MYPSLYIYPSLLISLAKCVQAMLKICGFAGHLLQKSPTLSVDCRTDLKDKPKGMQRVSLSLSLPISFSLFLSLYAEMNSQPGCLLFRRDGAARVRDALVCVQV